MSRLNLFHFEKIIFWKCFWFLPCDFNHYLYLLIITMATLFNSLFSSCLCEHTVFIDLLSCHFAACQGFAIQDIQTEKQYFRNTMQNGPPNFYDQRLNPFLFQDSQCVWGQNSFVPQEEVACYLMRAPLQLAALRCGNLQTELSRAMSHTGTILLCIIYSLAQYKALAFFTFTGLINMIHYFDIGASLLCDC